MRFLMSADVQKSFSMSTWNFTTNVWKRYQRLKKNLKVSHPQRDEGMILDQITKKHSTQKF